MKIFDILKIKKSEKICSECGTKLNAEDLFCSKCGKKYESRTEIVCPNCNASISKDSSFCAKCGKSLTDRIVEDELDFSQKFDFYAQETTLEGDLKGDFRLNGKTFKGIIKRKAIRSFGWNAYEKIGLPIRCSIHKQEYDREKKQPIFLLHVEQISLIHKKGKNIPNGIFSFTATDVSNKNSLLGRVIINGRDYKGSIQNSDLPTGILPKNLIGKTFSVIIKSSLQDKVAGEPFYPLLINDTYSILKADVIDSSDDKFNSYSNLSCEEKIKKALKNLEQEGCLYFKNVNLNQTKTLDDVVQSLPSEKRDYALKITDEIKHAIFDLKEDRDGVNIKKIIKSVREEGILYLEKEKQINTFLAALYFEIHDLDHLKEYLNKEIYNNFGFYFSKLIQEDEFEVNFAKKHIIIDRYLPHMDRTVVFAGVCEILKEKDYRFLKEIEKINDKESFSSILKFLLHANSISYGNTINLSKSEEYRYLYRIACEKFLDDYQVEKKKIIFNSELSSETYLFTPDDVSQLGASLGKVDVNGALYKGSIQKSDLPQGQTAWQLIGSTVRVHLKGDLQTGQPGSDYYKLLPSERQTTIASPLQAFPLYARAHELKFKENKPLEAKSYYIKSINDEREKQKRVSAVPDLVSIFIQEGNYSDAISYLTKYKIDIRPQAYDSFMNTIAIKQGKHSDYVPTTSTEFPLYDLAHQTLFDFRQRDEAIVQYREAIHAGQNVGTATAELITVLIQIQEFDECADLLAKYGKEMKPTAYENQKKQVLSFRPDLEAKILGNKKINKKSNLQLASKACDEKDFDKAIMFYEASIQEKEDLNQSVPELIQLYLKFGMESLAESIYTDYQNEVNAEKRKTVLHGFYEYYLKLNNEIKKEEIKKLYFSSFNEKLQEKDESEINNSELEYSDDDLDYFKEIVIACSLPMDKLKGNYSESYAIDLHEKYENFLFECSEEDLRGNKDRIRNYLPKDKVVMMLKMIKGFVNSKHNSLSNKETNMYVNALIELIMYFGDNSQEASNFDFARYCYKKITSLFSDSSKQLSEYWAVAILKYFETYNYKNSLPETFEKSDNKQEKIQEKLNRLEKLLNSIQNDNTIDNIDFFVSCISILKCINKYKTCILENIYKSKFNNLLCEQLKAFNNLSKDEEIGEFKTFSKQWQNAERKYFDDKKDFIDCIRALLKVAKEQSQLSIFQNELRKIEDHCFVRILYYQDNQYFTKLLSLLKLLNDFYSDDVFEQQKTNLESVVKQTKLLIKSIREIPTEIFYDSLLSDIVGFELTLSKIVEVFFQNGKPELEFIIVDDAIEDFDEAHNRILRIPLKIKNKENVQNALNLNLTIKEDTSSFEYNPDWANGQKILSGKSIDNEILFEFPESFDISSDIQFKISYTFEYYQDFTQTSRSFLITRLLPSVSIKKNDPYILREGQNPYAKYAGGAKPVDEESMFFGRDELLEKIQDRIENRKTKWICLYGQRRTGKTSILNHSINKLSQNKKNIIVKLDIEMIENLQGFFFKIIYTLNEEITEKKHPKLKAKMISDGKNLNAREVYNVPPEVSETFFTDMLHDFILYLETIDPEYKIIVFIDEFTRIYDSIRSGQLPEGLMHWWKRFIENENIIAVTIGQDHMPGFIANPIYNNDFAILSPDDQIIVTTIDSEASKRLIQEPIPLDFNKAPGNENSRFDEEAITSLQKLTSGNAYLTMTLCSDLTDYLIQRKRSKVHNGDIAILINDIELKKPISTFATYFDPLFADRRFDKSKWSAHKEKNIEIMKKIAVYTASTEYMPRDKFTKEDQDFITYLVSRGVLDQKDGKVKILVELCQKWLYLHKEDVISYETKEF